MSKKNRKVTMNDLVRSLRAQGTSKLVPEVVPTSIPASKEEPPLPPEAVPRGAAGAEQAKERRRTRKAKRDAARRNSGKVDDAEYLRNRSEFTKWIYLSAREIEAIHLELIKKFADSDDPIDSAGAREGGALLSSAAARPRTGMRHAGTGAAKYPKLVEAAAALTHSLIHDHPFPDGNKRTATLSLIAMLYQNKRWLVATETELYNIIVSVADHQIVRHEALGVREMGERDDDEVTALSVWINEHTVHLDDPKQSMQWRKLKGLLQQLGCQIREGTGNKITVRLHGKTTTIGARNDGDDLDRVTISNLQRDLEIPSLHTPLSRWQFGELAFYQRAIEDWRGVLEDLGELDRGTR